mmetsp:Transcript_11283/g.27102  ORF Transcript_11283/g.27102 Transcript_11283/m.27102 type:complete len:108 (+) Transcript_11283:2674-2997(+)
MNLLIQSSCCFLSIPQENKHRPIKNNFSPFQQFINIQQPIPDMAISWWICLIHVVHTELALVEPSSGKILSAILCAFTIRKSGVNFPSGFLVHDLDMFDFPKLGTLV